MRRIYIYLGIIGMIVLIIFGLYFHWSWHQSLHETPVNNMVNATLFYSFDGELGRKENRGFKVTSMWLVDGLSVDVPREEVVPPIILPANHSQEG